VRAPALALVAFLGLGTLGAVGALGCKRSPDVAEPVPAPSSSVSLAKSGGGVDAAADVVVTRRKLRGGTDVTFLVSSDAHFGYGYPDDLAKLSADPVKDPIGLETTHRALVPRMNTIAGTRWPSPIAGVVGKPRGLLISGDLTEWGRVEEWKRFVAWYGLQGTEGPLHMPVFEVIGNHDKVHGPWVEQQVAARHGGRFYAWDWDDLHLIALGEAPDDEGLAWLARDLDTLEADVPIVVYFHLALEGPWSTGHWFGDGNFKERLAALLAHRRVVGIFHGHHHATDHYVWHGTDVYKPGAVKGSAHTFAVVNVTDTRVSVAYRNFDNDTWQWSQDKALAPR
jgi:hypothetical protein